jgi:hypothetical protein
VVRATWAADDDDNGDDGTAIYRPPEPDGAGAPVLDPG